jgi:hypothetical protein
MSLPKINVPLYELVIPSSGKKIKYRPFLVKEEKILLLALESEQQEDITNAIVQIIDNCVQSRIKSEELSTFDVEYIFLNIRAKSVSEELEFSVTCPDDGETQVEVVINIDDIKVVKDDNHKDIIDIGDGYMVKMRYPTLKYIMTRKTPDKNVENLFEYIVDCLEQIYNEEEVWETSNTSKKEIREWVETLTPDQYKKLQDFFNTMPKLAHTINITNPNTGVKSDVTIEGLANFFA